MVKFTDIPEKMKYPSKYAADISTIHSSIIEEVVDKYSGTFKEKNNIISAINRWTYSVIVNNFKPKSDVDLIKDAPNVDEDECREAIGDLYITPKDVVWNIQITESSRITPLNTAEAVSAINTSETKPVSNTVVAKPTKRDDLYIKPPIVPRFISKEPLMSGFNPDTANLAVYTSLPIIPTNQNEISATTDINKMTNSDFQKLFPNVFIQTRSQVMYSPVPSLSYHEKLGVILKIDGFTEEQVIDNIIKYPHLFKLYKVIDGQFVSFYSSIEIDGELKPIREYWYNLHESNFMPYNVDFMKEYVVRRYLLERDVKGVDHKYKLFGYLDPFLTLFTTPEDYISWGYTDTLDIARKCVMSRIRYKTSRNPVIRRLKDE